MLKLHYRHVRRNILPKDGPFRLQGNSYNCCSKQQSRDDGKKWSTKPTNDQTNERDVGVRMDGLWDGGGVITFTTSPMKIVWPSGLFFLLIHTLIWKNKQKTSSSAGTFTRALAIGAYLSRRFSQFVKLSSSQRERERLVESDWLIFNTQG